MGAAPRFLPYCISIRTLRPTSLLPRGISMKHSPGIYRNSNQGRGSLTSRCLATLRATAVVVGVMQVYRPFSQHGPVLPLKLAVIVISVLPTDLLLIEPYLPFLFPQQADLVRLLFFAVVGSFISVMIEPMHKSGLLDTSEEPRS